eukprot:871584-Pleurochrysis_carterae.AAC.1
MLRRQLRHYRRRAEQSNEDKSGAIGAVAKRTSLLGLAIEADLEGHTAEEQARVLNRVLKSKYNEVLDLMRKSEDSAVSSYAKRERFLAVRWKIKKLRENWWTAEN